MANLPPLYVVSGTVEPGGGRVASWSTLVMSEDGDLKGCMVEIDGEVVWTLPEFAGQLSESGAGRAAEAISKRWEAESERLMESITRDSESRKQERREAEAKARQEAREWSHYLETGQSPSDVRRAEEVRAERARRDALARQREQTEEEAREAARWRNWTSSTGDFSLYAYFVSAAAGQVTLRKENRLEITLPMDRLSQADQDWIKKPHTRTP